MLKRYFQYLEAAADNTYNRYSAFECIAAVTTIIVLMITTAVAAIICIFLFVKFAGWYAIPMILVGVCGMSFYNFWKASKTK